MTAQYDLVIRGGTVADGLGSPLVEADVAVSGGRIADVGKVRAAGAEEIDARGLLVTPGFVDIHTHFDGQATWDDQLLPSSWHGVTTVVTGNCGVGFAPVRPGDQDVLIELMEGIEDIPGTALHDGLEWNWESFGEYLDVLGTRSWDVDVCAQLPHAPLRVYVMGDRARRLEYATSEDIARMREITRDAMRAGAIGFSTSRLISHKSIKGDPTPSYRAHENELTGIALGVKDAGRGVLQLISDFYPEERAAEYAMIERILRTSGRPMSISITQFHDDPDGWREHMGMIARCRAQGLEVRAQVAPRPVGGIMGLTTSAHPFKALPTFVGIAGKPLADQLAAMRDPEFRSRVLEEAAKGLSMVTPSRLFPIRDRVDYGRDPENSVAAIAQREGRDPNDVIYDLLMEKDGSALLFWAILNYYDHDYRAIRDMLTDPASVIALGDAGAHVGAVVDATFQTTSLQHWGDELGVSEVVRLQTSATAATVGLHDRGVIAPGKRADLNVIDMDALCVSPPYLVNDLPSGAKRLMQRAGGYVATTVAGVPTYRDGEFTGALPGQLVRGAQSA